MNSNEAETRAELIDPAIKNAANRTLTEAEI